MPTLLLYGREVTTDEDVDRADDIEGMGLSLCSPVGKGDSPAEEIGLAS